VSERKLSANRANAKHSTGPRSRDGKARSSLNALRHGILAKAAFNAKIDGADRRAEFDALVEGLAQEYQPQTMTEEMTVQQLAGCYWRLAKVWRYEQAAAWRMWIAPGMPMDEFSEFDNKDLSAVTMREELIADSHEFLIKAGLEDPTIPNGATARTIVRYQASIQTMITRCLSLLERRHKQRMKSDDRGEEATEATAKEAQASAKEVPAASKDTDLPKRTQKAAEDAMVSSEQPRENREPNPTANAIDPNRAAPPRS
jgi:hypothetical protein